MASYTSSRSVHKTLSGSTVDIIELTLSQPTPVTIVNRDGTAEIYGFAAAANASGAQVVPPDPAVAENDTFVLPAAISSLSLGTLAGPVTVKLISSGTPKYSVLGF